MPKKTLKCPKCDRTFFMPAHLVRHVNAIHENKTGKKAGKKPKAPAKKKGRKTGKKKVAKRKAKRGVGRPKGVAKKKVGRPKGSGKRKVARGPARSVGPGAAPLVLRMQAYQRELQHQRDALDAQIAAIAGALAALGTT
ncbi:MAG: hypothetical protein IID43_05570 [Planctomycetes bacterium]|nr:hypothetical protein [Planctomycetota bacterium]